MNKPMYVVTGEAKDQEKIVQLRPQIEDWVRDNHGTFTNVAVNWNMNKKNNFDFIMRFYA